MVQFRPNPSTLVDQRAFDGKESHPRLHQNCDARCLRAVRLHCLNVYLLSLVLQRRTGRYNINPKPHTMNPKPEHLVPNPKP